MDYAASIQPACAVTRADWLHSTYIPLHGIRD